MPGARRRLLAAWYRGARWLIVLRPFEFCYRGLIALRSLFYRCGFLPVYRVHKPVVVIGNLTLGGTGKTPVVIALAQALGKRGLKVGVVSRGYGADSGVFPRIVDKGSTAAECGDEPLLIYRRTGCPCVVGPSRATAVKMLLSRFDVDIVLSDDGLQHYALARDLEIVMYDAKTGFGNGYCLPAGPLREPLSRLGRVDYVLSRGAGESLNSVQYQPVCLVNLISGEQREVHNTGIDSPIYAIAGIGHPHAFFTTLRTLGFTLRERVFPDHHRFLQADFSDFGSTPIIMTEKDAVKCRGIVGDNAWYLRINATIPDDVVDSAVFLVEQSCTANSA